MKKIGQYKLSVLIILLSGLLILSLLAGVASQLGDIFLPIILRSWPQPSKLIISELLYNPVGKEPDAEWVEFYNAGNRDIDLSTHKFGDEETIGEAEGMVQFPVGYKLASGETIVVAAYANTFIQMYGMPPDFEMRESDPFVPNMIKYTAWAGGNIEFNNTGDEVIVLNEKDEVIDFVAYGNSPHFFDPTVPKVPDGYSLERNPVYQDTDTAMDWIAQPVPNPWIVDLSTPTPTQPVISSTPTSGEPVVLLISEVLYDPVGNEPQEEWIELYNPGSVTISLTDYKVGDEENKDGSEGMLLFPEESVIGAKDVVVIANQATSFFAVYGFSPDYEISDTDADVADMIPYTPWAGISLSMHNDGDEILILDPNDNIVDQLSYGDSIWAFNPPAADVPQGHSLERSPSNQDTDTAMDWIDQPVPNPGGITVPEDTPTPTNTQLVTPSTTGTFELTSTPTYPGTPTETTTPTSTLTATPTPTFTAQSTPTEARLLISEVLYDPFEDEPQAEWIELYNGGGSSLDLTGYKIGDEETLNGGEGMYRFPDESWLVSGQVIVIANQASIFVSLYGFKPDYELSDSDPNVPDMIRYSGWASGNIYLSNSGDEVLVLSPSDSLVDSLSWGDSNWAFLPAVEDVEQGHSLERRPVYQDTDSAVDWHDQIAPKPGVVDPPSVTPTPSPTGSATITGTPTLTETPTPTGTQTSPASVTPTSTNTPTTSPTSHANTLLISEVLYDSTTTEPDNEWLELYNPGETVIDLTGFKVGDEETQGQGEGMYAFPEGTQLEPGGVLVIAYHSFAFEAAFGIKAHFEFAESDPDVPDMIKYNLWATGSLGLNNTGDEVLLLDGDDNVIDAISWGSSTWAFDPAAIDVIAGHSLERVPADQDTGTAGDWIDQESPDPGQVDLGETFLEWFWGWIFRILR